MIIDLTARYPVANVSYRRVYSVPVTKLVIHYLDFGNLPENATEADELLVMDAVYAFHVNTRHWGGMGYHAIAFRSGRAYKTADWARWGAHTYMENDDSRGFAVAGKWPNSVPPESLQRSVAQLVNEHDFRYALARLYGHRDFVQTTCPGNKWLEWVPQLGALAEEDGMSELTDALHRILTGKEIGGEDGDDALLRRQLGQLFEKNARASRDGKGVLSALKGHLKNHPSGGGPTLNQILDGLAARMQN